jgi:hypothetical protein
MQRVAEPEEIAAIALYLASNPGSYATGQSFVIDGGKIVLGPTQPNQRSEPSSRGRISMKAIDGESHFIEPL